MSLSKDKSVSKHVIQPLWPYFIESPSSPVIYRDIYTRIWGRQVISDDMSCVWSTSRQ